MSQPLVSICIPAYNHARYLPATIDSALAQVYSHVEILITDDGSTDESLQIAEHYASRYPNVRVITHPDHANRGISATVNLGLSECRGEYWSGLPSDDQLHPLKVAEQVAYLEAHNDVGWAYGYALCVDEADRLRPELGLFGADVTTGNAVENLILGNSVPGMAVMVRRSIMEQHDESLIYSDWDYWVRLAAKHKVAFIPHARVRYRVHGYNTSIGAAADVNYQRSVAVMRKLRDTLDRPRVQALLDLQSCFFTYQLGAEQQATVYLAAALATDPTLKTDAEFIHKWARNCQLSLALANEPQQFILWLSKYLSVPIQPYSTARLHWESKLKTAHALLNDPQARREPALLSAYLKMLAGARITRLFTQS